MTAEQDWAPCRPGEISELAARRRRDRHQGALVRGTSVAAVVVLLVGATAAWFVFPRTYTFGGITCAECIANAPAFVTDDIEDRTLAESVRVHFERCPKCGPHLEEFRRRVRAAWLPPSLQLALR